MSIDHYYNLRKDICTLFHILSQFAFPKSEIGLDSHHHEVNAQVPSRDPKSPKIENLRKLENFKNIRKKLCVKDKSLTNHSS